MINPNSQFSPPLIADFRSVAYLFPKNQMEGIESLFLAEGKKFHQAKGISASFKAAVISRSAVMQVVRRIRAMTVPLRDLY